MIDLKKLYEDQRLFNRLIFNSTNHAARMERFRELGLGMMEETIEHLRTFEYKPHRRRPDALVNIAHSHEELIDMFKYWLSLAELSDFPIEKLERMYFDKSAVVQYRWQEEWVSDLDGQCVIIDIDGVLCDYANGLVDWIVEMALWNSDIELENLAKSRNGWIDNTTLQVSLAVWREIKHRFRTSGGKRNLPVFDDAKSFLEWCRASGWIIILLTSRPVDIYPNIFTDTLAWLREHNMPFDYVWWSNNKTERLVMSSVLSKVVFAVDDDQRFIKMYDMQHVPAYWLVRHPTNEFNQKRPFVTSLQELQVCQTTQTPSTDRTRSMSERHPVTLSPTDPNR